MELMRELGIAYIESRYPATSAAEVDLTEDQDPPRGSFAEHILKAGKRII